MDAPTAGASGDIELDVISPRSALSLPSRDAPLVPKRRAAYGVDGNRHTIDPRRCKRPRVDSFDPCGAPTTLPPEIVAHILDALPDMDDAAACIASGVFCAAGDEALRQRCRRTKKRDLVRAGDTETLAYMHARRGARFEWSDAVLAASSGHMEALRWLWTHARKGHPCDILTHAAHNGHVEVVQWLLEQQKGGNQWTDVQINQAIIAAVSEGHDAVVGYLCETNSTACTPAALATAVVHGRLSIAKMLYDLNPSHAHAIDAGAADLHNMIAPRHNTGLNGIGWRDRGLFDLACISGHLDMVEFVWQTEHNGCTPRILMCAAGGRNPDVVRFVARNRDAIEARVTGSDPRGARWSIDSDPVRVLMIAIPSGDVPTLVTLRDLFPAIKSAYMGGLLYLTDDRDMASFVLAHTGHPGCDSKDIALAAALGVMPDCPLPIHKSIGRLDLQTVRYAREVRGYNPRANSLLDSVSSGNTDVAHYLCQQRGVRSMSIDDLIAGGADDRVIVASLAHDIIARAVDLGCTETVERALDAWIPDRRHKVYHIDAGLSRAVARHRDRDHIIRCLLKRRRQLPVSERAKPIVLAGNGVLGAPVASLDRLHREWDMDIYALVAYDDRLESASISGIEWARQHGHDIIKARHAHSVSALVLAAATRGERRLVEWFASRGWRPCSDDYVPTPCIKGMRAHYDSAAEEILAGLADDNTGDD
ncbi:Ankyrin repeat domain containing protein [Pandoravirus macleodensis]|uniref:Ankyrin repeat domain containing protein n=1 Tax=Pandoravirus macleodensis TaxID=2107707 RepID=A0A2U7UE47_9VIRU|nr:Ankyrin repeat domain containing protein [Pandoravirus macleodensis]AVK76738.1 Ankyrin repeat domain containing protein [Pandoravirus macleodensis]